MTRAIAATLGANQGQLARPQAAQSLARIMALKPGFSARAELERWNAAPADLQHLLEGLQKAGLSDH